MTTPDTTTEQMLCGTCGWTMSMICPECPGCGCYNGRCSGWRHREFAHEDDLDGLERGCEECGASGPYDYCDC